MPPGCSTAVSKPCPPTPSPKPAVAARRPPRADGNPTMNAQTATVLTAAVELPHGADEAVELPAAIARPAPARRRLGSPAPDPLGRLLGPPLPVLFWPIGSTR